MDKIRFNCWKDGKKRALTMSYDDGVVQDRRLVEIFNKYGIRGSFHINGGLLDEKDTISIDEVATLYKGHEVSSHSLTHPFLERVSQAEVVHEILEDRRVLENACGYPVRGMSYPMGTYNDEVVKMLPMLGIKYARTTHATRKLTHPNNFLEWHPTCHHKDEKLFDLLKSFRETSHPMPLFYVWGHSYEFDHHENWDLIERFCAEASGDPDTWYATNIEIYDYMMALRALEFSADRSMIYNPTATDVWVRYDHKSIKIPAGETVCLEKK